MVVAAVIKELYVPNKLDFDSIMRRALTVSNTNRDLPFAVSGTEPTKRGAETE